MDERLLLQLKRHEGRKRDGAGNHRAYRCSAGALTIGYGHNLDVNPVPGISAESKLTENEAEALLAADAAVAADAVDRLLPWTEALTPPRRAVLVNMAFNLGINGLLGFAGTLGSVKRGDFKDAARRMLTSKWASQVGYRAKELSKQMETGEWQ